MKDYFPGYAAKAERRKLRSVTGLVLAVVAGLVIAGVATCANGQTSEPSKVSRGRSAGGPMELRLYEKPCTDHQVLTHLVRMGAGEFLGKFKAAALQWEGQPYAGCWMLDADDDVIAVYEDGSDLGAIPMRRFRDETL